jgi:hypothetical protein
MTGVEVSAFSWPRALEIPTLMTMRGFYYDWERSEGHWIVVSTSHAKYGDGLARDPRGIWYGVIIVAD